MRSFEDIHAIAAARKGGPEALEQMLSTPATVDEVAQRPLSHWLEQMSKAVFQAGFNWKIVDQKWPSFQTAFDGFDVNKVAFYADTEMDRLVADKSLICNGAKLTSVIRNAHFLQSVEEETGGAASYLARWPLEHHDGLLMLLAKKGARLGGITAQRVCRMMGRDSYVLSEDVCKRLVEEGVLTKPVPPTSKSAMKTVQEAFNSWRDQSGRPLTQISQILAMSVD